MVSLMNNIRLSLGALAVAAALSIQARAGSLSYVGIPATGSDAGSGIDSASTYTSAVEGGNTTGADRTVNGVPLAALVGSGGATTAGGVTFTASTGSLANAGGANSNTAADGALLAVLGSATFVHGADPDSTQTIALDPSTLAQGTTYDLRLYIGGWSGQNRMVNLAFTGDGQDPVGTDFFNEDDATSSAGGFATPNQAYYIDYQYTWDGSTTPTISITQKDPHTPFHLYALTNQVVSAPSATEAAAPDAVAAPAAAPVSDTDVGTVSSDAFYTPLQSSGDWVSVSGYGNCWRPHGVSQEWRPYTDGYWAHTDCGWTWVSNERWGWATYHYGRWAHIGGEGWVWVPGRVWAPAWVSWRYGGDSVGWAPLPPAARFAAAIGISIWADRSYDIGPSSYNFCPVNSFGSENLAGVIYPRERNTTLINNTTNITNIVYNNHNTTVYNGGPNLATVNAAIARGGGRPVPTMVLNRRPAAARGAAAGSFSQVKGNQLSLVAPRVIPNVKAAAVPKIAQTIKAPKIDHGWSGIKDPKVAAQLRAKVASEAKGKTPQNTHAQLPAGLSFAKAAAPVKPQTMLQKLVSPRATPVPAAVHTVTPAAAVVKPKPAIAPAVTPVRAVNEEAAPHTPIVPAVHDAATPAPKKKPALEHFNPAPTPAAAAAPNLEKFNAEEEHATTPRPAPKPTPVHIPASKPAVHIPEPKPTPVHIPGPKPAVHIPEPKPTPVHVPEPKPAVVHVPEPKPVVVHATPPPHPKNFQQEEKLRLQQKNTDKKDKTDQPDQ